MLVFHGYGERAAAFVPLAKKLGDKYTVYAMDLPGHGKTVWKSRKIESEDFQGIVSAILEHEGKDAFSVLGFSYGARVCLLLAEAFPDKLKEVFLAAPDGISVSGLYRIVQVVPDLVKRFCFWFLVNKKTAKIALLLHRRGWLNHHNYRFAEMNFCQRRRRRRLFIYWMSLDNLQPDWLKARRIIAERGIKLKVILATNDEVIPTIAGRKLTEGVDGAEVFFIAGNHRQLRRAFIQRAERYF